MRYLKATCDLKLKYANDGVTEIHCDADRANDKDDSKSICGFVVILLEKCYRGETRNNE